MSSSSLKKLRIGLLVAFARINFASCWLDGFLGSLSEQVVGLEHAVSRSLRGQSMHNNSFDFSVGSEPSLDSRRLFRDTDDDTGCFSRKNKINYHARNPWNSNDKEAGDYGARGDWGKCIPSPLYAVMSVQAGPRPHNPNPGEDQDSSGVDSTEWRGQLHDWPAGVLYEALVKLHEEHCAHVEVKMSGQFRRAVTSYLLGEGTYRVRDEDIIENPEGSWLDDFKRHSSELRDCYKSNVYAGLTPREKFRKSIYCTIATLYHKHDDGEEVCRSMFSVPTEDKTFCPVTGGGACAVYPAEFPTVVGNNVGEVSCQEFCESLGEALECKSAEAFAEGCEIAERRWNCTVPAPAFLLPSLRCTCGPAGEERSRNSRSPRVQSRPLTHVIERKRTRGCTKFVKAVVTLNSMRGIVSASKVEQHEEKDRDLNSVTGYQACDKVSLTQAEDDGHCSMGQRATFLRPSPCIVRLDQLNFEDATRECVYRGGRLANFASLEDVRELSDFAGDELGVGLFDFGANDWRFHGGSSTAANEMITAAAEEFGHEIMRTGCMHLTTNGKLEAVSCHAKIDWICEGRTQNGEASNDLKADEGSFCLWHYPDATVVLPNDQGGNFANTDLACSLQTDPNKETQCAYDPDSGNLISRVGDAANEENYPVLGRDIGFSHRHRKDLVFLKASDASDDFHCHFSVMNDGLLRTHALQHVIERSYVGQLSRTCGCGYKNMANLVSRCDCTRSGKQNNNCAKWQKSILTRATAEHPVKCNNCNSNDPL